MAEMSLRIIDYRVPTKPERSAWGFFTPTSQVSLPPTEREAP